MTSSADPQASLLIEDLDAFKSQQAIFVLLNLLVIAVLLLSHTLLASYWGNPPRAFAILLLAGFLLNSVALIWLQGIGSLPGSPAIRWMSWASVGTNAALSFTLALLSNDQNVQYSALMAIPVIEAAFRFSLAGLSSVVGLASFLNFFWVWWYFHVHPPALMAEYLEAGTMSLLYAIIGPVVWLVVRQLRCETRRLLESRAELRGAQERLVREEKLAAVGRLSSAIAHEVRNPVAMISSSLSMALHEDLADGEREQMFEIAGKEAERLEKLTADFLRYARPAVVERHSEPVAGLLEYAATACRANAASRGVELLVEAGDGLRAELDSGQAMQAIQNLVMNAIDASSPGGRVMLKAGQTGGTLRIWVENSNGPIPASVVRHIFEPFFTTKPGGTGLGLAIARNVALAHGGELRLDANQPDAVRFVMSFHSAEGGIESYG